jgi:hypothetical protein
MISIKIGKFRKEIWFQKRPFLTDILSLNLFQQCSSTKKLFGFKQEDYFTKIIDLNQSEEAIFSSFSKTAKNQINRSVRENLQFEIENDNDFFIDFYNKFAKTKGLPLITNKIYFQKQDHFIITKVTFEGETLVVHSYLLDKKRKLARIHMGGSHYREREDKHLIGRANRFLLFQDMLYLKKEGFTVFDLGGYGVNTENEEILRINEFKDQFGGVIEQQSNYTPYLLLLVRKLKLLTNRFKLATLFSEELSPGLVERIH